jgi:hypothetical protein
MGQKKHFQQQKVTPSKVRTPHPYAGGKTRSTVNRYASGKSMHNVSYQLKKEKQEKFRNHRSAALREYAKLCKREGVESERVNLGPRKSMNEENDTQSKERPKKKVVIPFYKEQKQAKEEKEEREKREGERGTKEMEIAAKKRERIERNKDRMRRTKKGQPLLDNTVKRLLETIKKS